jgi:hypothetical protein
MDIIRVFRENILEFVAKNIENIIIAIVIKLD